MSLKIKDITGKMESVEILDMTTAEKDDKKIVVLKCKSSDNQHFDVGLFGEDIAEKVLDQHGSQKDGKNLLEIPASKITGSGIVWLNSTY